VGEWSFGCKNRGHVVKNDGDVVKKEALRCKNINLRCKSEKESHFLPGCTNSKGCRAKRTAPIKALLSINSNENP